MAADLRRCALYLLLSLAFLWPLPLHLTTSLPATPYWWDAVHHLFVADTSRGNLFAAGAHRLDALAFHPHPHALVFSEHLLLFGLVFGPIEAVSTRPAAYNTVLIVLFALAGFTMDRLARRLGARPWAAAIAGAAFAFSPIHLFHLTRATVLTGFCFPLAWQALFDWWERRRHRRALALGACLALPAFISLYTTAFVGLSVLTLVAGVALTGVNSSGTRRGGWQTLVSAIPPLLVAALYNMPYFIEPEAGGLSRTPGEIAEWSGTPRQLLSADPLSRAWGELLPDADRFEGSSAFLGAMAWAILLLGSCRVLRRPRASPVASGLFLTALCCVLFFFGPTLRLGEGWSVPGPWAVLMNVPGLQAIRALRRFSTPLLAAALALGAPVLSDLVERRTPLRRVLVPLLFALLFVDLWPRPIPLRTHDDPCANPLWQALAARPDKAPVFSLPYRFHAEGALVQEATRCHGHPTTNGALSYFPADLKELRDLSDRMAEPEACRQLVERLRGMRVGYAAISARSLEPPPRRAARCLLSEGATPVFSDACSALLELPATRPAGANDEATLGVDLIAAFARCQRRDTP